MSRRVLSRATAAALVALTVLAGAASPVFAHVTIDSATANDDGTTTFTFTFDHGCGESPTVELHVRIPDAAEVVRTTQPDGWSAEPGPEHSLRWTGPPIAVGDRGVYTLTTTRFGHAGETVMFPTVQGCEVGEHAWINTDPASDEPAPFVVLDARTANEPPLPAARPESQPAGSHSGTTDPQVALIVVSSAIVAALTAAFVGQRRKFSQGDAAD